MILLSASKVWLWVQRDGIWSFLTWTRIHFLLHQHPDMSLEVVEETLLILQVSQYYSLLKLVDAVPRWMFSGSWSPPRVLIRPSAIGKINSPFFFGKYHFFRIESLWVDFRCVHRLQLLNVCNQHVTLPNSTRVTQRIRGTIEVRLSFQIYGFLTGPSQL